MHNISILLRNKYCKVYLTYCAKLTILKVQSKPYKEVIIRKHEFRNCVNNIDYDRKNWHRQLEQHIKENDECTIMIMQKTGAMGMAICNIGLGFSTVIAGFFNQIVFFSLLGATAFTALVKGFFKLY